MPVSTRVRTVKVTAYGDSITYGWDNPSVGSTAGGWRYHVWQAHKGGYAVDLAGTRTSGLPSTLLDDDHEGVPGETIGGTGGGAKTPYDGDEWVPNLATVESDIVLLQLGTNDLIQSWTTAPIRASMASRLGLLLDHMHAVRPTALIHVSTIPPISGLAAGVETDRTTFNAAIPGVVATRSAWATWSNIGGALTLGDLYDGIHPSATGYATLGTGWNAALATLLIAKTATVLGDGRTLFGGAIATGAHLTWLQRAATLLSKTVPAVATVDEATAPLVAYVQGGTWVVSCDYCNGVEAAWIDAQLVLCSNCWNYPAGGASWRRVALPSPADRAEIERILALRPILGTRWWLADEDITDLQAQNAAHGLGT